MFLPFARPAALLAFSGLVACGSSPPAAARPASPVERTSRGAPPPEVPRVEAPPAIQGERGRLPLFALDGTEVTLASVGARVTVVALWGASCVPCIHELPHVDALYEATRGEPDVAVFTLVVDDVRDAAKRQAVKELVARLGLRVPVFFDRDIGVYRRLNGEDAFGTRAHEGIVIPQVIVVDPAFSVHRTVGFRAENGERFVATHRALIDLARHGRLPPDEPTTSPAPAPDTAGLDGAAGRPLGPLSTATLSRGWP